MCRESSKISSFEDRNVSRDVCPLTFNSKTCCLQSRVKSGNIATHRISVESPDDSILRSFGPLPFPFHGNAYILSIRFVGIMAPSGTRRSSFNARAERSFMTAEGGARFPEEEK